MNLNERLAQAGWKRYGALAIPPSRTVSSTSPQEQDYQQSYLTYSELFGHEPTLDEFFHRLRATGLRTLVRSVSFLTSAMCVHGPAHSQGNFVAGVFDDELKARLAKLPNGGAGRPAYTLAQATFLVKAAVLHSPDRDDDRGPDQFLRHLTELLLMAHDLIDQLPRQRIEAALAGVTDPIEDARQFLPHAIRATLFNAVDAQQDLLARASIILTKIAKRDDVRQRAGTDFIDVSARFKDITGIPLEQYFSLGFFLLYWFMYGVRHPRKTANRKIHPSTFFAKTRLDPSLAKAILEPLIGGVPSSRAAFEARTGNGLLFSYDTVPFMKRPLFEVEPDLVVPVNLSFLAHRLSVGVFWILFDAMDKADRKKWTRFFGRLVEAYVCYVLRQLVPAGSGLADRVISETKYKTGQGERWTPDAVVLYADAAIFFEVTSSRLRMNETLLSDDPAAAERDLDKIVVQKARQLSRRIDDFRAA